MSLVGPRPEQVELVERYAPEHRFRLDRQAGHHRADAGLRPRAADVRRAARGRARVHREPLARRDLRILALTISAVVSGKGLLKTCRQGVASPPRERVGARRPGAHLGDELRDRRHPRARADAARLRRVRARLHGAPLRERPADGARHPAAQRPRPGDGPGDDYRRYTLSSAAGQGLFSLPPRSWRSWSRSARTRPGLSAAGRPRRARSGARRLAAPGVHPARPLHGEPHGDRVRDRRRRLRRPGRARPRARRGRPRLGANALYAVAVASCGGALAGGWAIRGSLPGGSSGRSSRRTGVRQVARRGDRGLVALGLPLLLPHRRHRERRRDRRAQGVADRARPAERVPALHLTILPIRLRPPGSGTSRSASASARVPRVRPVRLGLLRARRRVRRADPRDAVRRGLRRLRGRGPPLRRLLRRRPRGVRPRVRAERDAPHAPSLHRRPLGGARRHRRRLAADRQGR